MKKTKILFISEVLVLFSFLSSCQFFQQPVKEYLKEYTESAAIEKFEFDEKYPTDKDGYTCLSSTSDITIKFFLRNPQKYTLVMNHDFVSEVSRNIKNTVADSIVSTQDPQDISVFNTVVSKELLEKLECGGDFTSSITLQEPKTQRTFNPYELKLRVNSAPQAVQNLTMLQNVGTGKYVLAFNMPDLTGIHHDIEKIKINDLEYPVKPTDNPEDSGLSGEQFKTAFSTSYLPAMTNGSVFAGKSKAREIYYESDVMMQTEEYPFTVTLVDNYGIETSARISASSEQLKDVTCLTADLTNLIQDSKGYAHISFKAPDDNPDAIVYYTVSDTTGRIVKQGQKTGTAEMLLGVGKWNLEVWAHKDGYMDSKSYVKTVSVKGFVFVDSTYTGEVSDGGYDTPYKSLNTAIAAAVAGSVETLSVKLLSNCSESQTVNISGLNVEIEGAGKSLTGGETLLKVSGGKTLTISNTNVTNGTVRIEESSLLILEGSTILKKIELTNNAKIKVNELTGTEKIASIKIDSPVANAVILESVTGDLTMSIINRFELNNPGYYLDIEEGKGISRPAGVSVLFNPDEEVLIEVIGLGTADADGVYTLAHNAQVTARFKDETGHEITPETITMKILCAGSEVASTNDNSATITVPDSLNVYAKYSLFISCVYNGVMYSTECVFQIQNQ